MHRVPHLLLSLLTAVSLHAALIPGPERSVSTARPAAAHGYNYVLDVATDGTDFLTLWTDSTPGRLGLYATILDGQGVVRAGAPEALSRELVTAHAVWTGDAYLVVGMGNDGLAALRLDRDAQVLSGPAPIDLPEVRSVSELVWNGSRALVVFSTPAGMRAAILGSSGEVLRSGIELPAKMLPWSVTAAAAGPTFVLAWWEEDEPPFTGKAPLTQVRALRISPDGAAGAPFLLMEPASGWVELASASSAATAGIVFSRDDGQRQHLHRFTVDATAFTTLALVEIRYFGRDVDVISTPSGFVATYMHVLNNAAALAVMPFSAAGTRDFPLGVPNVINATVESNGHSAVLVGDGAPVVATAFDAALSRRTSEVMPAALVPAARQSIPAMAHGGGQTMVAWLEPLHGSSGRLMLRRFDRAGNALDAEPILAGTEAATGSRIAVAFTGRMWLVVWQKDFVVQSRLLLRRVSVDGVLLDPAPIDIGIGYDPVIASNGTVAALLVAYPQRSGVGLLRFSPEGQRLDAEIVRMGDFAAEQPAIATNGNEFLAAWSAVPGGPTNPAGSAGVYGRRLDASGASMDAAPIAIAAGPRAEMEPQIASNGTDFVVVYGQYDPIPESEIPPWSRVTHVQHLRAKRVLRNGALADFTADQDGHLLAEGALPNLAFLRGGYVLTYVPADPRTFPDDVPNPLTILARPLDARGAAAGEAQTVVRADADTGQHALTATGDSVWLAYARMVPENGNVQRVFTRTLTEEPPARRRTSRK